MLNRLTKLENCTSDDDIISSYTSTLDAAGKRANVGEHTGRIVEYTYDDTYKLLEEKITSPDSSTSVISYTYDAVGNRLIKTENGFTATYQYDDNNHLIKEDDITYSYDDNGNLKEKTSAEETITTYSYDDENHLTRVTSITLRSRPPPAKALRSSKAILTRPH
jgi:YD repeat-containing protein